MIRPGGYRKCVACGKKMSLKRNHVCAIARGRRVYGCMPCDESGAFGRRLDEIDPEQFAPEGAPKPLPPA